MPAAILVPLDGSRSAECALPVAALLARRTSAVLHLVHVHLPFVPDEAGEAAEQVARSSADLEGERRDIEQVYLASIQELLQAAMHIVVARTLCEGPVIQALLTYAEQCAIDLIVVTSHGGGPPVRVWLGSVAENLVRQSTIPLLLVRPRSDDEPPAPVVAFQHVMVPLDGSARAEEAIAPALSLAGEAATITLVRVVVPPHLMGTVMRRDARALEDEELRRRQSVAREELAAAASRICTGGRHVEARLLTAEHPATAVFEEATARGCDLIALSPQGQSGWSHGLVGSVADKLLRISECPVLIVPEGQRQAIQDQQSGCELNTRGDTSIAPVQAVRSRLMLEPAPGARDAQSAEYINEGAEDACCT